MKILVTGGAGFIGSHLSEELVNRGHKVVILDNLLTGRIENFDLFKDKIEFVKGSINDKELVDSLTKGIDYIFHQAALPSVPRSIENPVLSSEINIQGSLNIFNSAIKNKVKRVIYASSSSVYGNTKELPKIETMKKNPMSPYALQKSVVEEYAKQFNSIFGLNSVGLRYFNVFGERQDPNSDYAAVVPKFIKLILKDKIPTIFGDGTTTRDFTYVQNVVEANIKAMEVENIKAEIINIGCGKNYSLNNLVEMINSILKKDIKPKYEDFRKGDVKDSLAGISKAKEIIDWEPTVSFRKGIEKTINYFRAK